MMWARVGRLIRSVAVVVLCLGWMGSVAGGQQANLANGAHGSSEGSVRGVIELGDTGEPAAGANVFLTPPPAPMPKIVDGEYIARDQPVRGEFQATADAAGRVEMAAVRPGEYLVVTQVPGYVSPEEYEAPWALAPVDAAGRAGLPAFVQTVKVEAGKETHFGLRLERGGVIEGRVTYADHRPAYREGAVAFGIAVNLLVRKPGGGFGHGLSGAAHTDADGHYRIEGLPAATYGVQVAMIGGMVPVARGEEATQGLVMYDGGTQRLSRAETVTVKGHEVVKKDLVLPVAGLHTVSGRVIRPDGRPVQEGRLRLAPAGETDRFSGLLLNSIATPIERDGSFHFQSVLPDTYTLSVEEEPRVEMVGLTADGKGLRMRVVPSPYAPVSETVTVGGAEPVEMELRLVMAK